MPDKNPFFEEEAAQDSDEEQMSDSSDEEEDDLQKLRDEAAGFIVDEEDDDDEEEEAPASASRRKKRRRRKRDELELDDEDLNLVEENTGKKIKRNKRVFKRQEERTAPVGRDGLAREFGAGDDFQGLEDFEDDLGLGPSQHWRDAPEGSYDEEAGEMDDFIEHDGEMNDEQARAHRRALAKTARNQGISVEAAQELLEIFGQDAETQQKLEAWYSANEVDHGDAVAEYEEEEAPAVAVDPVLVEQYHLTDYDETVREANCPERLYIEMKTNITEKFHATDAAQYIYDTLFSRDAIECLAKWIVMAGIMEVEGVDREPIPVMMEKYYDMDDRSLEKFRAEHSEEMENIKGFRLVRKNRPADPERLAQSWERRPWMTQEEWMDDQECQDRLLDAITNAIRLMFLQHYEVPVLATFFKEQLGELLCFREVEGPKLLTFDDVYALEQKEVKYLAGSVVGENRTIRRWDVLWAVYDKAFTYFELLKQQADKIKSLDREREQGRLQDTSYEAYKEKFQTAMTVDDLNEWFAYFRMLSPPSQDTEEDLETGKEQQKRPRKVSRYHALVHHPGGGGVHTLVSKLVDDTDTFASRVDTISQEMPGGFVGEPAAINSLDPDAEAEVHIVARLPPQDTRYQAAPDEIQRTLAQAAYVVVQEIATHPVIRAKIREIVRRIAVVSTDPTEVGDQTLSPFHKYGSVKRIRRKPIMEILRSEDQFLRMLAAEKEGLVKLKVEVLEVDKLEFLETPLVTLYTLGVDDKGSKLHSFRTEIISKVLNDNLIPMALDTARKDMKVQAEEFVLHQCSDSVWIHATTPPLQLKAIDEEDDRSGEDMEVVRGQRMCVVCWGDKAGGRLENATRMVMLDSRGYPTDVLSLPQLSGNIPASPTQQIASLTEDDRKADDVNAIVEFLEKHWPHLIVIGTSSMACDQLHKDISKICEDEITQDQRNEHLSPLKYFVVRLVDDSVASIYESCRFATGDLKEHPRLVRRAIALGRSCMEPLAVLSALMMFKDDPELLALQVHSLQGLVPKDKRARAAEQLLMTAIAQEGVSINECAQKDWMAPMLQFVPGLGPRKAQALVKGIKSLPENDDWPTGPVPSQTVISRDHLLKNDGQDDVEDRDDDDDPWRAARQLRKSVYANAAPFLRVCDPNELHESNEEIFAAKDNMRVHPRDEGVLTAIACAALDIEDPEQAQEDPVPEAIRNRNKVMQVDIAAYDETWQYNHGGRQSRISTFADLAMELCSPYGSLRAPERLPLTEEETFWALTGEDPMLLKPGMLISARVVWVKQHTAGLVTDSGILCHLQREDANSVPKETLEGNLVKGMEISARVKDIDFRTSRLILTSASTQLEAYEHWEKHYLEEFDPYYHVMTDRERREVEHQKQQKMKKKAFQNRPINHHRYVNMSVKQVKQALVQPQWNNVEKLRRFCNPTGAADGDAVFHPHPKVSDRIQLSIRLFTRDNKVPVIQTIDILETKANKMGNQLQLGTPLRIQAFPFLQHIDERQAELGKGEDRCKFEDLDELLVRFARPYFQKFKEVMENSHFCPGNLMTVDETLNAQFMGTSIYKLCLRWDEEAPMNEAGLQGLGVGWGVIACKVDKKIPTMHFPFRICHAGYYCRFRKGEQSKLVGSVKRLVGEMKTALTNKQKADQDAAANRDMQQQPPPGHPYGGPAYGGFYNATQYGGFTGQYGGAAVQGYGGAAGFVQGHR